MPEKGTKKRAAQKKRRGNAPSTQAGEYVREEMHHKKSGKHKIKSRKQAVAIGLSKARKAGVRVPKKKRKTSKRNNKLGRAGVPCPPLWQSYLLGRAAALTATPILKFQFAI